MAWFYGQLGVFLPYKWSYNSTWISLEPARVCGIEFTCFFGQELQTRWWFQRLLYVHPENWGNDPIWRSYFSNGLVQPPTSRRVTAELDPLPFDFCGCSLQNCMNLTNLTFATASWWLENMFCLFTPIPGEMIQFVCFFFKMWLKPPASLVSSRCHSFLWFLVGCFYFDCASCVEKAPAKTRTGRARFKVKNTSNWWHDGIQFIEVHSGNLT